MSIPVTWADENRTLLRLDMSPGWTWAEFAESLSYAFAIAREHDRRIDLVWVVTALDTPTPRVLPPGNPLPMLGGLAKTMPLNIGLMIFVNASTMAKAFGGILARTQPQVAARLRFVDTIAQAQSEIEQARGPAAR